MKQKTIRKKITKNEPNLSDKMRDPDPHNFICYLALKDNVTPSTVKANIMFIKKKNPPLQKVEVKSFEEVEKKGYRYNVICLMLYCNAQQYVSFKHYLNNQMKKQLVAPIEATQKDIEKIVL